MIIANHDRYQNAKNRLRSPLRRRGDGTFEEVSWEVAIRDVAGKLRQIRDTHGGHALAYYGGGGQGNHMGGAYSSTLRSAMGTRYIYNSLAQEKTGGFWLNGRLFGRQTCHVAEDVHHSDYVLFIGTNPWQSHGFPQARKVLLELAKDPQRTMVVIDPRRTLGLEDGQMAICESSRGAVEARVEITDELRPGVASLPHGYGLEEQEDGSWRRNGPAINELTASDHCDELAKTPFHKHIPVRIRPGA